MRVLATTSVSSYLTCVFMDNLLAALALRILFEHHKAFLLAQGNVHWTTTLSFRSTKGVLYLN